MGNGRKLYWTCDEVVCQDVPYTMQNGNMRRLLILLVAALLALAVPAAAQPAPYTINVVLSLTGPAASLGGEQQAGLLAFEKFVNRTGGIRGVPVHFKIADDQSSPTVAVQLFQSFLPSHPVVVLGSSIAAQSQAMAGLVKDGVGPVLYALTPNMLPTPGSYVFATSAPAAAFTGIGVTAYRLRGVTKIGVIVTTDASGKNSLASLEDALKKPANKNVKIVDIEVFGVTDVSVAAQAAKIKASGAQMIYDLANGTAFGTSLHGLSDVGFDVPVFTSAGNFSPALLNQFKSFLPSELTCAGAGFFNRDRAIGDPQKKPIDDFYAALAADGVTQPTVSHAFAWDPALIVVTALRQLGTSATASQLHGAIENVKGLAGAAGIYDFSVNDQHEVGENALLLMRYDPTNPGRPIIASRQGGAPI
jgi:branched-chain amino acid transport system substrate-binding protein